MPRGYQGEYRLARRVMITGSGGQLGRELARTTPAEFECRFFDRSMLDIGDASAVQSAVANYNPDMVINAAAYTAVDRAEQEPDLAKHINGDGPAYLASACQKQAGRLLQVSTDFVFNGGSSRPYRPDDTPAPLSVYGQSKLQGEEGAREALPTTVILRTGWVYSAFGNNFVKTMLRLMAERDELSVVDDQVGTPTWAKGLAEACWSIAASDATGLCYHHTDAGVCSWYDFACAIGEEALELGMLSHMPVIRPIPSSAYPTPAVRPAYSVLDKQSSRRELGLHAIHWRQQLRCMLQDLKAHNHD